jgi:hypothetical protein
MKMKKFLTMVLLLCISLPAMAEWKMIICDWKAYTEVYRFDEATGKFEQKDDDKGGFSTETLNSPYINESYMGDQYIKIDRATGQGRYHLKGKFDYRGTCAPYVAPKTKF